MSILIDNSVPKKPFIKHKHFSKSPEEQFKREKARFRSSHSDLYISFSNTDHSLGLESSPSAEGALLDHSVLSSHFIRDRFDLNSIFDNLEVFKENPIIKKLYNRNYSVKSLNSMLRCGQDMGFNAQTCGCGQELHPLTWHCCKNTCPICSPYRATKIRRRLNPFLSQFSTNPHSMEFLGYITFSPDNYDYVKDGYKKIREDFAKFLRLDYVKKRIYGGFIVIESKTKNKYGERKGWNIHIHCLYYGRFMDNRIRGHCNKCGQNLIKQDHDSKEYYCANRNCNSFDITFKGDSKLVSLWKKSSGRSVMIDIQRVTSVKGGINYMTKYMSANKDDFYYEDDLVDYIEFITHKKLISAFGSFFGEKLILAPFLCKKCGEVIHFSNDPLLIYQLEQARKPVLPNLPEEKIVCKIIKIH